MEKASKSKSVRAVPEGYHTVTPYLVSDDAAGLIRFIEQAFDGKVKSKMMRDDNRIMHASISIGDSIVMISDTMEGMEPHTAMIYLYLDNADETYQKAIRANATSICEPKTEFYGDRAAAVKDASGNTWWMATHVEDVSEDDLRKRSKELLKQEKDKVHA